MARSFQSWVLATMVLVAPATGGAAVATYFGKLSCGPNPYLQDSKPWTSQVRVEVDGSELLWQREGADMRQGRTGFREVGRATIDRNSSTADLTADGSYAAGGALSGSWKTRGRLLVSSTGIGGKMEQTDANELRVTRECTFAANALDVPQPESVEVPNARPDAARTPDAAANARPATSPMPDPVREPPRPAAEPQVATAAGAEKQSQVAPTVQLTHEPTPQPPTPEVGVRRQVALQPIAQDQSTPPSNTEAPQRTWMEDYRTWLWVAAISLILTSASTWSRWLGGERLVRATIRFAPVTLGVAGGAAWVIRGWGTDLGWLGLSFGLFICCAITVVVTFVFQILWHFAFGGSSAHYVVRTSRLPKGMFEDQATHVQVEKHEATSGTTTRFDNTVAAQLTIGAWALGIGAAYGLCAIASIFILGAR